MTIDHVIIIVGILCSLTMLYNMYDIVRKAKKIRNRHIHEKAEDLLNLLSIHFAKLTEHELFFAANESIQVKEKFKEELTSQIFKGNFFEEIRIMRIETIENYIENVELETSLLQNLQESKTEEFIKETAALYLTIVKFILFFSYIKRKEDQFKFKFNKQAFDYPPYHFKLSHGGRRGIEHIVVG